MLKLIAKVVLLIGLLTALGVGIQPVLAQAGGCMCMTPTIPGGGGCATQPDGRCIDITCGAHGGSCMKMRPGQ